MVGPRCKPREKKQSNLPMKVLELHIEYQCCDSGCGADTNSCHVNTVLQALYHLDFVKEAGLGYDVLDGLGGNHFMLSDNDALIIHVQQLFQKMRKQESGSKPINSLALQELIRGECEGFEQEDASSTLQQIINVLVAKLKSGECYGANVCMTLC